MQPEQSEVRQVCHRDEPWTAHVGPTWAWCPDRRVLGVGTWTQGWGEGGWEGLGMAVGVPALDAKVLNTTEPCTGK